MTWSPGSALQFRFTLSGDVSALRIPTPAEGPADRLWEHTCFEAFVRGGEGPGYVEFNFAPSGQWARYEFADYRERIKAPGAPTPLVQVERGDDRLSLVATVPADALPPLDAGFALALTTVVEAADGSVSYWALRHPPGRPDFHHADGFACVFDAPRPAGVRAS